MGKSKELKVMTRCWNQLVPFVKNNLEEVSLFLYNKDIIRKQTRDEVTDNTSVFGPEERAKKVLRALEDKIEEDDDNYYVFVCFLSSKSELSKLVKSLSAAFCELGGTVEDYNRRVSDMKEREESLTQESTGLEESWQPSVKHPVQMELSLVNIKTFLRDHNFPAAHADKLGEQLDEVNRGDILTYKKNHNGCDWDGILIDIIDHWLNNDLNRSWEKLARALSACGYKAIAAKILGNEPQHSGASTAKAEEEKEPLTRRRIPLLQRDLEKPSSTQSSPQRNLPSDHTRCNQCILVVFCVGVVAAGLFLLVFLVVSKGSDSPLPAAVHPKHDSTPDKGISGSDSNPLPTAVHPKHDSTPNKGISGSDSNPLPTAVHHSTPDKGSDSNPLPTAVHHSTPDKDNGTIKLDSTDCTTIKNAKRLEYVLKEVSGVPGDRMCSDLDITRGTCNSMGRKDVFTLSQKYMEQHPEPCWENIIQVLCNDFDHHKLAKDVKDKYGVPEQVYKEYCKRK